MRNTFLKKLCTKCGGKDSFKIEIKHISGEIV